MDTTAVADSVKPAETGSENEAHVKYCEVGKAIGLSDDTLTAIKKDLGMETAAPEVKAVEVSVEKIAPTTDKHSAMVDMISSLIKNKVW